MNKMKTKFNIRDNIRQGFVFKFYRGSAAQPLVAFYSFSYLSENLQF